jgi:lysophospholipase L1-like esterase
MNRKWKTILILSLIGNLFILYVAYKALDYRRHVNYFLDKYTYVVSEFSGRNRYASENKRLASDVQVGNRIVFLGSQITEGWDLDKQFPGYEAINRGISGQRMAGFLLRLRPDVIDLHPRAVVIEFSSYNFRPEYTLEETEDYLASLAELAKVHGIEPVLTTIIPIRERVVYDSYSVVDSLIKYNQWLAAFSRENGYLSVDFYDLLANDEGLLPQELSISHIELNSIGYERISQATRAALDALE